jgi:predicted AAA+ superfamily ATPase
VPVRKSTVVRHCLPQVSYVSFDDPDEELALATDPKGFLARFEGPVILDEVQRVPVLFRYLKMAIDADPGRMGRFILTGSNQLALERGEVPRGLRPGQILHGSYPGLVTKEFAGAREWYAAYLASA